MQKANEKARKSNGRVKTAKIITIWASVVKSVPGTGAGLKIRKNLIQVKENNARELTTLGGVRALTKEVIEII
jgi:hypothetical protein